ncbi:transcriptional regulator [Halorubrum sp. JWXQ-INN 858]|uniref:RAD55 family ATPase n=1 Tax=Halorubrum sp. JWXQ-INN 858 TaxID=2690782 RepID=UPI00135941F1|nr:transcriptional regulator [Halorubrum sp. JWXQ-INN 858]MWV64347.1 transcriptional regulator [Halorubrum sp. JWXQ-INN 858]
MDRLPTGVSVLDRELDGGVPSGSIVVLKADPASQSELFLNTFSGARPTTYLTTVRSSAAVEQGFERAKIPPEDVTVDAIDGSGHGGGSGDAGSTLENATARLDAMPERGTLVIDSLGPLEAFDPEPYRRFLAALSERVTETGGVAVLHAMTAPERSRNRIVSEQVADVVFDLRTTVSGTDVVNRLVVPKFRGGVPLDEPLKLKLTDGVAVDTSRDIA